MLLAALAMAVPVVTWPPPASAQTPAPPPPPATGQLGGKGPCGSITDAELDDPELGGATNKRVNAWNQFWGLPDRHVWVYEPSGPGVPRTGGVSCSDNQRPVALVAHGYPAQEWIGAGPAQPYLYGSLIQNLVSNGYIVVFANYDANPLIQYGSWATVWTGLVQAVKGIADGSGGLADQTPMTARANPRRLGIFGHSFGGGMAPQLALLASAETVPGTSDHWGQQGLWVAMYAASDGMYHCNVDDDDGDGQSFNGMAEPGGAIEDDENDVAFWPTSRPTPDQCNPTRHPVNMPPNARVLIVNYDRDELGGAVWWASERLYLDMQPVASKWGIWVRTDCSHSGGYPCSGSAFPTFPTGHLTPNDPVQGTPPALQRGRNHIKWYANHRNVNAVAECAMFGTSCNVNLLLPMGVWSDGAPATSAQVYTPAP